jgi:adhesin/invasin
MLAVPAVLRRRLPGLLVVAAASLLTNCSLDELVSPTRGGALTVAPLELTDSARVGSTARRQQTFTLGVQGATTPLTFGVSAELASGWIVQGLGTGTAPSDWSIGFDPTDLAVGDYRDTLRVSSDGPDSRLVRVPVLFRVLPCELTDLDALPTAATGTLTTADCASISQADRYSKRFQFTGAANDSVTVRVLATDFSPRLTLRRTGAMSPIGFADSCPATGSGACTRYVRLPEAGTYEIEVTSNTARATGDFELRVAPPRAPALPGALAQRVATDLSQSVAAGATLNTDRIALQASLTDDDLDSLRLEIELRPLATPFTGAPTATSALLPGPTITQTLLGLTDNTVYRWQARSVDVTGRASAWVAFGAGAADFAVGVPDAPAAPAAMIQRKVDGVTPLALGATTDESIIRLGATLNDPDPADQIRLELEVRPLGTPFTNVPTHSSAPQAPGTSILVSVAGLLDNGQYRWQARAIDQTGRTSAWTPFGGASTHFRTAFPPAGLGFLTGPSTATAGAAITPSVRVAVQGAGGSTLASYAGPVTVVLGNANGAILSGTTTVNAVAGVATFTNLSVDRAGIGYTLTASAAALEATSAAFAVTSAAAANLQLSAVPAAIPAGQILAPALTVTVRDALGNVATGFSGTVTVALAANADDAALLGTTSVAAVAGVATFSDLRVERASSALTIVASATGLANVSSAAFAVTAAAPAELVLLAEPATAAASGAALAPQPVLEIRDAFGNPVLVAGTIVTATITSGPGGASLAGASVSSTADGRATFTALAIVGAAGSYTLQFGTGSLSVAPASATTVGAGAATQLTLSVPPPPSAINGVPFGTEVRARLRDAAGNPVLQAGVSVTVGIASGGGALTGTTTVLTNTMGQAIFSDLGLLGTVGERTLVFSSGTLASVTSGAVMLNAGAATAVAIQAGDGQTAAAATPVSVAPSVVVRDVSGNPVAGVSVTFTVTGGGGSIAPTDAVVTGPDGIAALATWTLGGGAGLNSVSATTDGLDGSPITFTATATAGAASQITITGGDDLTGPVGTTLGTPHEVRVTDATGNPVAGVTVEFTAVGGGSVAPASALTDADGRATTVRTLGPTAGPQGTQASATLAGGLTTVTFDITATVGGATQLTLLGGDAQVDTVGATLATPLTVLVRDALDNPVEGVLITWTVLAGGGAVTPSTSLTDASGVASTTWRLGTTRTATDSTQIVRASGVASPLTFVALARPGAVSAAQTLVSVLPASVAASRGTPATVTVTARDGFGNPVAGVPVTLAVTGAGNTIAQPIGPTAATGVATGAIGATVTGVRSVSATANGVLALATPTLTVVAAPAASLLFLDAPVSAVAGDDLAPAPSVGVLDSLGNRNVAFTGSITLGLGVNPNGGTLSGTLSRNAVAGVVNFTGVAIDRAGSGYQLSATSVDLVAAQSGAIAVGAGAISAARSTVVVDPGSIVAGVGSSTITVTARDENDNPIAGATVVLAATGSDNTLTQPVALTDANGVATGSLIATSLGNRTVSATIDGLAVTQSAVVSVTAGAVSPTLSTITGVPSTLVAGVETSNVTVTARDAFGNAIAGATVVVTATGSGNTITQPVGTTNAAGVAVGTFVSTIAEPKTLSATVNGVALATSANVTVNPGAVSASRSLVAAAPDSIVADEGTSTITVTARDANDNVISGATVVLAASGAGNAVTQPTGPTDASGVATGSVGSTAVGNKTITATINGIAIAQSAVVRVFPAGISASQSVVEVADASIVAGDSTTITVLARDANGNPVSGVAVVLFSDGTGDVITQPAAVTDASGEATGRVRATSAATRTISATGAGVAITQTAALVVTPSVPNADESSLAVAPTSIPADGSTADITVTVRDEFGNVVPGVAVVLGASGAGNALLQPSSATDAAGVATGTISATVTGDREISATADGLALADTVTLTVTPAAVSAAQSSVSLAPGTLTAGVGTSTVTVVARDANGNVVPGAAVTLAATGTGNTITQPTAVTDGSGTATGSIASTGAGLKTVTATIAGVVVAQTGSLTVTPAAIDASTSTIAVSAGTISAGVGSTTITVTVRDAFGNPIPGVTVELVATGSDNTLVQPLAVTNASGVATGTFSSTTSESKTVSATAGGVALTQTAAVNVVPDAASATTSLVSTSAVTLVAGTDTATITVTARDANSNPVPGVTVTLESAGSGVTFVQPVAVTDANGVTTGRVTGTIVGARTVTALLNGVAAATTVGLTITPAPVSGDSTLVVIAPQSIVAGASTAAVTVTARDAFGNLVPGVTVELGVTGASAAVTQPAAVTDASGVTTGGVTATLVGAKIVSATVNGAAVAMTDTLTVTPAAVSAAQSTIGAAPSTITAGGAASTITVTARDAFGNVVPGLAVTLSADGSTNTFVQPAAVTNASGVATGTLTSTVTGVRTVGASIAGTPITATTTVTVNPGAVSASLSTIGADPSSIVADGAPSTITVQVRDLFGNPVPGATVLLVANGSNNTVVQPAATDADGLTSGTLASLTAQTKSVQAIANGVTLSSGVDVTVTAGAVDADNSSLAVTPNVLTAGAGSSTITVTARDVHDNLIPDAVVQLFATGTGNTLTQPSGNTGPDGVASGAFASTGAGAKTITATVNGVLLTASGEVTVSAAAIDGTQSTLAIDPAGIVAGGTGSTATITVRDAFGNPISGATVVVTADPATDVVVTGPLATTNALGLTTATISATASGAKTISATAGGVSISQTAILTVSPGAVSATLSAVEASAASITAGSGSSTITVTARDAEGNLVPNAAVTLSATGSGNAFAPDASGTTDANGVYAATFSSTGAGAKTVSASVAGVAVTSTAGVTVTPAAASPATSQITASPTTVSSDVGTSVVTVALRDAFNNPLTGGTDVVALTTTLGAFGPVANNGNGSYSATLTATTAGAAGISGTVNGEAIADTATVNITSGGVSSAQSTVVASSGSLVAGTPAVAITVTARDATGNPVPGALVELAVTGAGASVTQPLAVTDANGVATGSLSATLVGDKVVSATIAGVSVSQTATVSVRPAAASAATTTIVASSTALTVDATTPITVQARDQFGNLLTTSGGTVTLGTTLGSLTAVTDNLNGTYTATLSATLPGTAAITGTIGGNAIADGESVQFSVGATSVNTSDVSVAPTSFAAGGSATITVQLRDQYGNARTTGANDITIGTTFGSITATLNGGDGTYTATLSSNATGVARVSAQLGTEPFADTVDVTVTAAAVSASLSTVTAGSASITAGGETSLITVTARDQFGNLVPNAAVVFASDGQNDTFASASTETDASGVATALFSSTTAEPKVISVTVGSVAITQTAAVTVTPAAASGLFTTIARSPASITVDETATITVAARDAFDNPLTTSGGTVVLGTTLGALSAVTDLGNGTYTATLSSLQLGTATISGTIAGQAITSTAAVSVTVGAPSAATSTITPSQPTMTTDGSVAIVVQLRDAGSNALSTSPATIALQTTVGALTSVTSNGDGTYSATLTSSELGTALISGTLNGAAMTDDAQVSIAIGAPSAVTSTFSANDSSVTTDQGVTVTVQLRDLATNAYVASAGSVVTITTDLGTIGTTTDNGDGTYSATLASTTVGTATVRATIGGVTSTNGVSVTFAGGTASASLSTLTVSDDAITASTGASSSTITVTARDAGGNVLPNVDVEFVATGSGNALTPLTATTSGAGVATATFSSTGAGAKTITATVDGVLIAIPAEITVSAADASAVQSQIIVAPTSITTDQTATVTVTLVDAFGNARSSGGNTVELQAVGGTIGAVTDNGDGTYTATFTPTALGAATITGEVDNIAFTDDATVTVSVGDASPSTTTIAAASGTITAGGSTTLTVQLRDAQGNARSSGSGTVVLQTSIGAITGLLDAGDGTWTATLSSNQAGTAVVNGLLNGAEIADTLEVTVAAAAVSASTSTVTAGTPSIVAGSGTSLITVTATDEFGNPVVGATVTFEASGNDNTFAPGAEAMTDGNGQATATFSSTEAAAKVIVVTVGTTELEQQPTVTVTPAAISAATSTVTVNPTTVAATVTSTVTITARDAFSNPVPDAAVSFSATGSGNTLVQPAATTDANGVTTGTISSTDAGEKVITATAGGTTLTQTPTLTVTAGGVSGSNSSIAVDPSTITASTGASATTVTVVARDANNNPIAGRTVVLSAVGTGDAVTQPGATTNASGVATGTFYSTGAGLKSVSATIDGVAVATPATVTVQPDAISAAQSLVSANPTSLEAGADTSVITITVRDQFSNPIAGVTVTLGATGGSGNAAIDPAAVTDASGQTTGRFTSTTTGDKIVSATAGTIPLTQAATVTVTPGPVSASLSTVAIGTATIEAGPEASTITVTVLDTLGNLVPNATVQFSATGTNNTLTDEDITDANGVATATFSSTRAEAKTITAVAGGVVILQTGAITVTPAAVSAAQSTVVAQQTSIVANDDGSETSTILITALDANDNPIVGATVTLAATGSNNEIVQPAATDVNGQTTGTIRSTVAEAKTITATVNDVDIEQEPTVTVIAAAPSAARSMISADPTSITTDGSSTITVQVRDAFGNNRTSTSGLVALTSSIGGELSVTDNADGTYTATLSPSATGTATISGTLAGVAIGTGASVTVTPGAAAVATSQVTVASASITAGNNTTVTVTLRDAEDNALTASDGVVTLALTGGSVGSLGAVTDVGNGTYTATFSSLVTGSATVEARLDDVLITDNAAVTVTPGDPSGSASTIALDPTGITASAGGSTSTITVTARDANGNVIPGATVVISATGTGNTLTPAGTTTDVDGEVTATFSSTVAEAKTISARINDAVDITPTATLTVGVGAVDADASELTVSDASIVASSGSATSTITATIRDANSNPISGVTVSFLANGATTDLSAASAQTDGAGVASVTFSSTASGVRTITASANAVTLTDAPTITVTPAAFSAANSSVGVSPSSIVAGTGSSTITVTVRDIFNNAISGANVALAATGNENTVTQPAAVTDAAGVATGSLSSTEAGVKTVSATADLSDITQTQDVTVTAGDVSVSVSTLTVSAPSIEASSGGNTSTITATILDANGNPIEGATVDFLVDAATTGLSAASAVTNGAGIAQVAYSSTGTGLRTVTASVGAAQLDDAPTIEVTPAAPSLTTSLITASDESITSDETSTITVQLRDEFGNDLTTSAGTVTLLASPGGALVVTPVGDGTYTATFDGTTATTVTISGQLDDADFTDNVVITVGVGAVSATQSSLVADPSSIVAGGGASTITVTARDGADNLIEGVTVVLASDPSDGTLTQPGGNTGTNGVATGSFAATAVGTRTISATVGGVAINASADVTVTPAAASAAHTQITTTDASFTAGESTTVTIQVYDAFGNLVTTTDDVIVLDSEIGSFNTVTSTGPGTYQATFSSDSADIATITGTLGGEAITDNATVTVNAGAATTLVFSVQPSDATAATDISPAVVVRAVDNFNNTDPTFTGEITLTLADGDNGAAELTGGGPVTATAGVATFANVRVSQPGSGFTLRADSPALLQAISILFNITL